MATIQKEPFRMCFLKIVASDFATRDLSRYGQHWNPASVTIVEAVHQMHISRTTTAGTDCERPGQMGFRTGRKCADFLMPYHEPVNLRTCPNRICNSIQRISGNAEYAFDAGADQSFYQESSDSLFCHPIFSNYCRND